MFSQTHSEMSTSFIPPIAILASLSASPPSAREPHGMLLLLLPQESLDCRDAKFQNVKIILFSFFILHFKKCHLFFITPLKIFFHTALVCSLWKLLWDPWELWTEVTEKGMLPYLLCEFNKMLYKCIKYVPKYLTLLQSKS